MSVSHPSRMLTLPQKQDASRVIGLALRDLMMVGHPCLSKHSASASASASVSDTEDSEKGGSTPSGDAAPSKRTRMSSRRQSSDHLGNIVAYIEQQNKHLEKEEMHREWEAQHMEQQEQLQERMVELPECSIGLQAQHQGDLISLLQATLMGTGAGDA
jgi:hypothetical protein